MPRRSPRIAAKMAAKAATAPTVVELNTEKEKRLFMIKMLYAVYMRISPVFEQFGRNCHTVIYCDLDDDPEDVDRLITQTVEALDKIHKFTDAGTTLAQTVHAAAHVRLVTEDH